MDGLYLILVLVVCCYLQSRYIHCLVKFNDTYFSFSSKYQRLKITFELVVFLFGISHSESSKMQMKDVNKDI